MNYAKALRHLMNAYEHLRYATERTRAMFWAAVAKLRALIALAEAAL